MVIIIKDHIEHCYSNDDGRIIHDIIEVYLKKNTNVTISFEHIDSVTSSFVNSAFIKLLDQFDFGHIRHSISFINSTNQINEMIKKRFNYEVNERKNLMLV